MDRQQTIDIWDQGELNGGTKMGLSDRGREERPLHKPKASTKAQGQEKQED